MLINVSLSQLHRAVDQFLLPWILETAASTKPRHILLVAHGILNPELIGALMRRRAFGAGTDWENTGASSEYALFILLLFSSSGRVAIFFPSLGR